MGLHVRPVSLVVLAILAVMRPPQPPTPVGRHIELDAVVVDGRGRPVRGLRSSDFEVKEDGELAALDSVAEISPAGARSDRVGRSVVLLLDDMFLRPTGTPFVQRLARLFLSRARDIDAVAVVRLTHRDRAVGSLEAAVEHVNEYRASALPYSGIESIQRVLESVTQISRTVAAIPHRRTAIVCIGARSVCDPYFERPEYSLVGTHWRTALIEAARANAAVYFVDPSGVIGQGMDLGGGLVEHTGGAAFVQSNVFDRVVDAIWGEAGHYYLLTYVPRTRPRALHSIRVAVKRPGVEVHARLERGE